MIEWIIGAMFLIVIVLGLTDSEARR